jgi:hypothetical protein
MALLDALLIAAGAPPASMAVQKRKRLRRSLELIRCSRENVTPSLSPRLESSRARVLLNFVIIVKVKIVMR